MFKRSNWRRLRRRPRRLARRIGRKGKKTTRLVKTIKRVLNKSLETKYIATELNSGYVYGNIGETYGAAGNAAAGNYFFNILPRVPQSGSGGFTDTSAHTRIGNRITPVKMVTTIQFYFQGNGLQSGQDLSGVIQSGLYEVRSISATPKAFKSYNAWRDTGTNNRADVLGKLLEIGDGSTATANSANPNNLIYPISNENWNKHHDKHFIMGKNSGQMNGWYANYNAPLTTARAQNTIRFRTKLPKVLIYDENLASGLPSNAIALWGCYAGILQNIYSVPSTTYDQLLDTNATSGMARHPILRWNLRTELWFKDA